MSDARSIQTFVDDVPADVHAEDLAARAPPRRPALSASLIPPALPRPPVSTCALTTTGAAELLRGRARLGRGSSRAARSDTGIP